MQKQKLIRLGVFLLGTQLAGILGSVFTFQSIPTWYATLAKPSFNPPNFIFGPVWTILYLLMGTAAFLVYEKAGKTKKGKEALKIYGIQLFLNFLWTVIFFGFKSPELAFVEILVLWGFIALTIYKFYKITPAGYLLIPYLAWVTFASVLNYSIMVLN